MKTHSFLHLFYRTRSDNKGYYSEALGKNGDVLFVSGYFDVISKATSKALDYILDNSNGETLEPTFEDCKKILAGMSIQEQLNTIYYWTIDGVISQRTFERFLLKFFRQR